MTRLPDWRTRLHRYLAMCHKRQFVWSEFDCATFAADAVEAMTGQDFARDIRGGYTTAIGAQRRLRALGYADVVELAEAHLPAAQRAREGDVVAVSPRILGVMGRGFVHGCHPDAGLWTFYERPIKAFAVPF